MTHDELLAEIAVTGEKNSVQSVLANALRKVVEFHKPQEITLPNGEWGTNCPACDGWDYPCPTIEIIEKELT